LKNKIGMNEKATKQIVSEIFGENGLIEADTTVDFTKLVTNIESKYEASVGAYLTDNIIPTIREYVYSARKFAPRIPLQWKNNSCESINPILKLNQNWAPEKLPELINKIHKEIILQENRVKGALYGHGDFELNNVVCHMQCTKIIWQNKSQKEKGTLLQKFLLFGLTKQTESSSVTSTDGKLTIPNTGACAKKPGQ
jgi:hypothetical protein